MEQLERARQFEEQRKAHAKRARKEAAELSGEGISNDIPPKSTSLKYKADIIMC